MPHCLCFSDEHYAVARSDLPQCAEESLSQNGASVHVD